MDYTTAQFHDDLSKPYAWPGGYPRYFICEDGAPLSYEAAQAHIIEIEDSILKLSGNPDWRVIGCEINWEDADLYCSHTGKRIESAYAEE